MLTIRTAVDAVVEPGAAAFIFLGVVGWLVLEVDGPGLDAPAGWRALTRLRSLCLFGRGVRKGRARLWQRFVQCGGYLITL